MYFTTAPVKKFTRCFIGCVKMWGNPIKRIRLNNSIIKEPRSVLSLKYLTVIFLLHPQLR